MTRLSFRGISHARQIEFPVIKMYNAVICVALAVLENAVNPHIPDSRNHNKCQSVTDILKHSLCGHLANNILFLKL
jgi:hypothetical protein